MNSNELRDQNNTKMPASARNPLLRDLDSWTSTMIVNNMKFRGEKIDF